MVQITKIIKWMPTLLLINCLIISEEIMAHTSLNDLKQKIQKAPLSVGDLYYHYRDKTKKYRIIAIGLQEATEEPCVIYQNVEDPTLVWVRNLDSWLATVDHEGQTVPRFVKAQ